MIRKNKKYSLKRGVSIRIAFLLIVLFAMLVYTYFYSVKIVKDSTITNAQSEVEIYKKDIDDKLKSISASVDEMLYQSDLYMRLKTEDESELYFTSMELLDALEKKIIFNNNADCFFVVNRDKNVRLLRLGNEVTNEQNIEVNHYFQDNVFHIEENLSSKWMLLSFGNTSGFMKAYMLGDTLVGAILFDESALSCINQKSMLDNTGFLLTDDRGKKYADLSIAKNEVIQKETIFSNSNPINTDYNNFMLVTGQLEQCDARLTIYQDEDKIFAGFTIIQYGIFFLVLFAIALLIYVFVFLQKNVVEPIQNLEDATNEVAIGNWNKQIGDKSAINEINALEKSFNNMIKEIKELKIDSYEEKIERQQIELRYLQMQIKPHFYLNALTTIHSMTYKNLNSEIRTFVEALSDHLRYSIREGVSLVTIGEEINHVRDYIKMQEIRFPNSVFFMPDIEDEIQDNLIPQFIILTFIENSFKYAMDLEKILYILIQAKKVVRDDKEFIHLHIEDNGQGFSEEKLSLLNEREQNKPGQENGLGIMNIKKTLQLFYGGQASVNFSNALPNGASVDIFIEKGEDSENTSCR